MNLDMIRFTDFTVLNLEKNSEQSGVLKSKKERLLTSISLVYFFSNS